MSAEIMACLSHVFAFKEEKFWPWRMSSYWQRDEICRRNTVKSQTVVASIKFLLCLRHCLVCLVAWHHGKAAILERRGVKKELLNGNIGMSKRDK